MKKYIQKKIGEIGKQWETKLHKFCLALSLHTRIAIAIFIVLIIAGGSVFLLATAFYQCGKERGKQEIMIKHITTPPLLMKSSHISKDSIYGKE